MLAPHNRAHASTTNAVGQSLGYFIAFTGFLALKAYGICSLGQFMSFWAVIFLITTFGVWFGKTEPPTPPEEQSETVGEVYLQMYQICRLPVIQRLVLVLVTWKIGFAAADSITSLKILEYGVPKNHMATMATLLTPLGMMAPMIVASPQFERWSGMSTAGEKPFTIVVHTYTWRLALGVGGAGLAYLTQQVFAAHDTQADAGPEHMYLLYAALLLFSAAGTVISTIMFVSQMSMFARIADPAIGGTYMTLLNTISNLGSKWPATLALVLVDPLTVRSCLGGSAEDTLSTEAAALALTAAGGMGALGQCHTNTTDTTPSYQAQLCGEGGGECTTLVDAFYPLVIVSAVLGVLWLRIFGATLLELQALPTKGAGCPWHVKSATKGSKQRL